MLRVANGFSAAFQNPSRLQEIIRLDSCLPQDRPERSFRHVARMIRNGCIPISAWVEPDFMAPGGLAVKFEAEQFQPPNDLLISESAEPAHSRRDHDRVVPLLGGGRQIRDAVALAPSLKQFAGDITRNVEGLCHCAALCDKAGEFVRGCKKESFRQFLDVYPKRQLHTN